MNWTYQLQKHKATFSANEKNWVKREDPLKNSKMYRNILKGKSQKACRERSNFYSSLK